MELKEYQKHIIEELVEEIFDHLSDIKHVEECDKTSKEDLDLYNTQKAFKHTKFLKEFLKDIQNCLNQKLLLKIYVNIKLQKIFESRKIVFVLNLILNFFKKKF